MIGFGNTRLFLQPQRETAMRIEIKTGSYNQRRYGRPWVARVTFEKAAGEYIWGEWIGTPGGSGRLEVEAEPGDIVAEGQKDLWKPRNSAPTFYVVGPAGELRRVDKVAAVDQYREKRDAARVIVPADSVSVAVTADDLTPADVEG